MSVRLYRTASGWGCRIRCGGELRMRLNMPDLPEAEAQSRADRMQRLAQQLSAIGKGPECKVILEEAAKQPTEKLFRAIEESAQELIAKSPEPPKLKEPKTFRDVANAWTGGDLDRLYPRRGFRIDPVSVGRIRYRLDLFASRVGSVPIVKFTIDHADEALKAVPDEVGEVTRKNYASLLRRALQLAVFPLRLIDVNPIPVEWIPKARRERDFTYLYPAEDRALMRCVGTPIGRRWIYGTLAREGCRVNELLRLRWRSVDLENGVIRLDKTKTRRPRQWRLADDTIRTMKLMAKIVDSGPDDLVFGRPFTLAHAASTFRADLARCEIMRDDLHTDTPERRRIRIHDLRGTFITLALRAGKSERWIMDRTGHTTSNQLGNYHRAARRAEELGHTELGPLDELLWPGQARAKTAKISDDRPGPWRTANASERTETSQNEAFSAGSGSTTDPKRHAVPAGFPGVGQGESPVETALSAALTAAIGAQEWELAKTIVNELGERRRARTAPEVPSLDEARRRKENGDR